MKPNVQVRILILGVQIFMYDLKIKPNSKEKTSQRKSHDLHKVLKVRPEKLRGTIEQLRSAENVNLWHVKGRKTTSLIP